MPPMLWVHDAPALRMSANEPFLDALMPWTPRSSILRWLLLVLFVIAGLGTTPLYAQSDRLQEYSANDGPVASDTVVEVQGYVSMRPRLDPPPDV